MDIRQTIKDEIKELAFRNVGDTESLLNSRLLSSIMVVDLAVSLEDKFKVKIAFSDINEDNFETVDLIEKYLHAKGVKA
jgi:acyl carrier protein